MACIYLAFPFPAPTLSQVHQNINLSLIALWAPPPTETLNGIYSLPHSKDPLFLEIISNIKGGKLC